MRYLPLTDADRLEMLSAIGVPSVDALFEDIPEAARLSNPLDLPDHLSELAVERAFSGYARPNLSPSTVPCFLGGGAYRHHIPASVDHLIQRGEFLTSYTPYQPEITQGTLQYLFEFQTQVALITGMDVANASMYDGASACGEAVIMAMRATRRKRALLSGGLHPDYRDVSTTVTKHLDARLDCLPPDLTAAEDLIGKIDDQTACVVVQSPDVFGNLRDLTPIAAACREHGALLVAVVTEIVSLGAVQSPGEMGADIVVAEGQSIGNPLGFGGPYVGLFATRDKYVRQMPGRLAGQTVDSDGRRGWVLTLSTREQHIRREKATSNICTNSGLCALAFTIHMSLLGERGFRQLAELNHAVAVDLADRLDSLTGVRVMNRSFFNEFTVELPKPAAVVADMLAGQDILAGVPVSRLYPDDHDLAKLLLVAATETVEPVDSDRLLSALKEAL